MIKTCLSIMAILCTIFGYSSGSCAENVVSCDKDYVSGTSIHANSYYIDKLGSIPDAVLIQKNLNAISPFRDILVLMSKQSDSYVTRQDEKAAHCVLRRLADWASNSTLLEKPDNLQSAYERNRLFSGISIVFLKVMKEANSQQKHTISNWLNSLSDKAQEMFLLNKEWRNNLFYWSGVGVSANILVSNRVKDISYAKLVSSSMLENIDGKGRILSEMQRGQMSLSYDFHAPEPMLAMERIVGDNLGIFNSEQHIDLARAVNYAMSQTCHRSYDSDFDTKQVKPENLYFLTLRIEENDLKKILDCYSEIKGSFNEFLGGSIKLIPKG